MKTTEELEKTRINNISEMIKDLDDYDFNSLLYKLCHLKKFFCSQCKHLRKPNHNDYTFICDKFKRKTTEHSRACNDFVRS